MHQRNYNAGSIVAASLLAAEPPLWTPAQTAAYLNVTRSKLERMRSEGVGPDYCKIGHKTVRYEPNIVYAWLKQQRCSSTATRWPARRRDLASALRAIP